MKKKYILLTLVALLVPLLVTLLQSCGCGSTRDRYFDTQGMSATAIVAEIPSFAETTPYVSGDSVIFKQFTMSFRSKVVLYGSLNFSGGSNLMACSPGDPTSQEIIEDIRVVSDKDFVGYPAGTNLAPIMRIIDRQDDNLASFLTRKPNAMLQFYLKFENTAVTNQKKHNFKITYVHQTANEVFEMTLPEVTFL